MAGLNGSIISAQSILYMGEYVANKKISGVLENIS